MWQSLARGVGPIEGDHLNGEIARIATTSALTGLASLLLTPLIYGVAVHVAATGYLLDGEIALGMLTAGAQVPRWTGSCENPVLADYAMIGLPPSPADDDGVGERLPGHRR